MLALILEGVLIAVSILNFLAFNSEVLTQNFRLPASHSLPYTPGATASSRSAKSEIVSTGTFT